MFFGYGFMLSILVWWWESVLMIRLVWLLFILIIIFLIGFNFFLFFILYNIVGGEIESLKFFCCIFFSNMFNWSFFWFWILYVFCLGVGIIVIDKLFWDLIINCLLIFGFVSWFLLWFFNGELFILKVIDKVGGFMVVVGRVFVMFIVVIVCLIDGLESLVMDMIFLVLVLLIRIFVILFFFISFIILFLLKVIEVFVLLLWRLCIWLFIWIILDEICLVIRWFRYELWFIIEIRSLNGEERFFFGGGMCLVIVFMRGVMLYWKLVFLFLVYVFDIYFIFVDV